MGAIQSLEYFEDEPEEELFKRIIYLKQIIQEKQISQPQEDAKCIELNLAAGSDTKNLQSAFKMAKKKVSLNDTGKMQTIATDMQKDAMIQSPRIRRDEKSESKQKDSESFQKDFISDSVSDGDDEEFTPRRTTQRNVTRRTSLEQEEIQRHEVEESKKIIEDDNEHLQVSLSMSKDQRLDIKSFMDKLNSIKQKNVQSLTDRASNCQQNQQKTLEMYKKLQTFKIGETINGYQNILQQRNKMIKTQSHKFFEPVKLNLQDLEKSQQQYEGAHHLQSTQFNSINSLQGDTTTQIQSISPTLRPDHIKKIAKRFGIQYELNPMVKYIESDLIWVAYLYLLLNISDYNLQTQEGIPDDSMITLKKLIQSHDFDQLVEFPIKLHPAFEYLQMLLTYQRQLRDTQLNLLKNDTERIQYIENCSWFCFKEQRIHHASTDECGIYFYNFKHYKKSYMMPECLMVSMDDRHKRLLPNNPSGKVKLNFDSTVNDQSIGFNCELKPSTQQVHVQEDKKVTQENIFDAIIRVVESISSFRALPQLQKALFQPNKILQQIRESSLRQRSQGDIGINSNTKKIITNSNSVSNIKDSKYILHCTGEDSCSMTRQNSLSKTRIKSQKSSTTINNQIKSQ
ncbi:UNKNOWN [Stylonychia lemnae]|uniref:Uncharacterized protein n=1 Tax=Stylonychia lemnae TaxID=5949 RepID=A0A078AUK8_STYLE|nr:UNKNOWN [Stylonychia lemnae]|eukprot:CDW85874.1 UNKNOWN [Stylonychia lemnae]